MPVMKAASYTDKKTGQPIHSIIGWYCTEKYDGQRAQWDSEKQCLRSRYGNIIRCPEYFIKPLRETRYRIDGELFIGYGNWDLTGIFRCKRSDAIDDPIWAKVQYIMFDIADLELGDYNNRHAILCREYAQMIAKLGGNETKHLVIPERHLIDSNATLNRIYKGVLERGGEGVMLNNPAGHYVNDRSNNLLKHKPVLDDQCVVVGYKPGAGRLTGKLGSFIVHPIEDGERVPAREFSIAGLTDLVRADYKRTHPIGTIINYRCAELSKAGLPRFPTYLGICRKPGVLRAAALPVVAPPMEDMSEILELGDDLPPPWPDAPNAPVQLADLILPAAFILEQTIETTQTSHDMTPAADSILEETIETTQNVTPAAASILEETTETTQDMTPAVAPVLEQAIQNMTSLTTLPAVHVLEQTTQNTTVTDTNQPRRPTRLLPRLRSLLYQPVILQDEWPPPPPPPPPLMPETQELWWPPPPVHHTTEIQETWFPPPPPPQLPSPPQLLIPTPQTRVTVVIAVNDDNDDDLFMTGGNDDSPEPPQSDNDNDNDNGDVNNNDTTIISTKTVLP